MPISSNMLGVFLSCWAWAARQLVAHELANSSPSVGPTPIDGVTVGGSKLGMPDSRISLGKRY
ncbi:hypothetical protein FRC12_003937 [Ceratobasidium sp. 428]|nr:hypothetical protein FRC12_003937 [Ceratobasidium sp. 428]